MNETYRYKKSKYAFQTRADVAKKAQGRALTDFVENYCTADEMPDEEMANVFRRAQDGLKALEVLNEMLGDNTC